MSLDWETLTDIATFCHLSDATQGMTSDLTPIGRFAPSPTGPLHFGSLVAASASYLDARSKEGKWLVRMEDVDKSREQAGAADAILQALEIFGFEWDGEILWQSQRTEIYQAVLDQLKQTGLVYPCGCTRREIVASARLGLDGLIYPGFCREGLKNGKQARAWRLQVNHQPVSFRDQIQGDICHDLAANVGDFVLKRADGFFAYQLAVVVDDAEQGVTDVVRGADLLDSTTRQIFLQQQLGFHTPRYAHITVATDAAGLKLSKQNRAPALALSNVNQQLIKAFEFLGLEGEQFDIQMPLNELWQTAISLWRIDAIKAARQDVC
ncbi:tRNA glutamyl-Q(34) synthetase GluQRS [Methylophaga lonarensis]|uniref:tRNA glutamyl-Q(34) synthetase GluQRS n=1 Tax=Methylophaga lonarensis TaxID=999151 RepID=UPI001F4237F5|nr:tRNA glutamyl-Q(34) synthetase GluQRS [Methylophaga lonarensis]